MKLDDWQDPWPDPIIEQYNGVYILRDDLIEYSLDKHHSEEFCKIFTFQH